MDQKERRKRSGLLLKNIGVFYIQRVKRKEIKAYEEILLDERMVHQT